MSIGQLKVRIYADGADRKGLLELYGNPLIHGLTTNPTLMRKAGIKDYEKFAREILETVRTKPISFEVFSDEFSEMRCQAYKIHSWQENVYVKIPVTNTRAESSVALIRELAREGVKLNVTAILTAQQVQRIADALHPGVPAIVSVFAGRIADTGVDPVPVIRQSLSLLSARPDALLLWASVREVLNIAQAEACGCHIVTVPHDILEKALKMWSMNLEDLSLDTVRMFSRDAEHAGFRL